MVIATTACVVTITTGGAALPMIGSIAATGVGGAAGVGAGIASAVAGAVGAAASGGAIAGATATGTAAGAGIGAAVGGTAAAGVGGSSAGLAAVVAGTGGIGLLVVGTSTNQDDGHITYDCWKPVLHDVSEVPSIGMYLKDLLSHANIQKVTIATGCYTSLPNIVIENIWKEEFQIEYMMLNTTGEIVCHAKQM
ncbi:uncharacterized protein LOC127700812 isoform X2 [Mytilus californianus]|uniref:uncharacterized protein LOC127700812 isoform X2 n=1 Tax=Mytilus californianus TaxID=6549 RepID=UPI002246C261|nr:uncharacterized protein LOC127700812 isoform X2 [Mytilus californianus]